MKLCLKDDDGKVYEIQEAKELQQGDVVAFLRSIMRPECVKEFEDELSRKLNRKVVVLDARFRDIVTLPPCREARGRIFPDRQPRLI